MDYPQILHPAYRPWPEPPARRNAEPPPVFDRSPDSISLAQLLQPLVRFRKTVLLCALAGLALAVAAVVLQKPVYEAHALVEIQDYNENFLNMRDVSPTTGIQIPQPTDTYLQTQIQLMQSDSLLERVANRMRLDPAAVNANHPGRLQSLLRAAHLAPPPRPGKEQFLKTLGRNLAVRPVGLTRIVEVSYASEDPAFAAAFANTLADEFISQGLERRIQSTHQTGELLTAQLRDLKANLDTSETALQQYAKSAGLLFTSDKDNVDQAKLAQLQDALSKAQDDRVAAEAMYNRVASSPADALPQVQDDATLRDYRLRLAELRRQYAELSATYTPKYYKVKEVEAQIATLESALESSRRSILDRIRNQYETARNREHMLSELYAKQAGVASTQAGKQIRYNLLKSEVDNNRQLYEAMQQKVKEAGIASGVRASNVQVVDLAHTPQLPARPSVPLYSAVGLFSGAIVGLGYVFTRKRNDFVIQAPGDISLHLNYPELGAIPNAARRLPGGLPRLLKGGVPDDTHPLELISFRDKHSPLSESFRAALASILFSGPKGESPRAIAITSSTPGEGKTVVASNFGIALAETGQRVLLVDGDLRRPRLKDIFNVKGESGLSTLLRDATPPRNYTAEQLGEPTEIPGLFVLAAGPESAAAANLLYSPRAAEILQRLRREFQAIVIDTPPLSIADARGLARLADGAALVVRADRTAPEATMAALRRLAEDGTWVLGTILNSWDTRKTGYPSYSQYS
jgi:capsular exopolysaccharide synthesis family protein